MEDLKVGDIIEITGNSNSSCFNIGDIGTIKNVIGTIYQITSDVPNFNINNWNVYKNECKLISPKESEIKNYDIW